MIIEITLQIILQNPPGGIDFGLQKGAGAKYETIQTQRSGHGDLRFNLPIQVKGDRIKDSLPVLTGPFAQGAAPNKFLYIDIGTYAGQETAWNRRLKIPLTGITWNMVDQLRARRLVLKTLVPGTGKDGGPNCATVKPFAGWEVKNG